MENNVPQERNVQGTGESLGKANTHQERPHQTWSTSKSDSTQVLLGDASTLDSLVDHRYHVLLMRTRSQLRNHTAVCTEWGRLDGRNLQVLGIEMELRGSDNFPWLL